MKRIDLKDYQELQELVKRVDDTMPLTIVEDKEEKYMLITTSEYDRLSEGRYKASFPAGFHPDINIITPDDLDLSDDDFEELKKMVLEALEGKLNKDNSTKS